MLSRPPLDRIAFLGVSWYGLLIVIGILLALFVATREEKRLHLPEDTAIDFALWAIPLGVVGARVYSVLFRLGDYIDNWGAMFNLSEGGLAIYGAVIGGFIAALIVARRKKISLWSICDMVAPGLVLAQAIGRWGNYFNMEAYGLRTSDVALQFFPMAVEIPVGSTWYWHLATFFYESMWDLLVFALLMLLRKQMKQKGDMFCWYGLLYGAGRAVIEGLRDDSLTLLNQSARISQIVSVLACLGIVLYFTFRRVRRINFNVGVLLASSLLAVACFFIGEFERNAYSNLFAVSQMLLIALAGATILLGILRMGKPAPFWMKALPFVVAVAQVFVFMLGNGREFDDNTLYVTQRQIVCMAQLILCSSLLFFAPTPAKPQIESASDSAPEIRGRRRTQEAR